MGAESVSVAAVRRLRRALAALDPGIPYVTLTKYADGRLSRSTLAELRQADSTAVPLWSTVWMFVLACLSYADEQSIEVPAPLRDLDHWQHLYDECRAQGGNVLSGTVYGAVVQADTIHGDVTVAAASGPVPRSAYLEQVARIAPEELHGRDRELSQLAVWCLRPDVAVPYLRWRARAWAGKSALLSWFVLHPPAGIRIVSFFVTARLSGQNDKRAFTEVVLEQLAQLCGQPLPELLTEATRDAHLLALLGEAAGVCERDGNRLVLVVDGLDEDRGVTIDPDSHSIAALLPARPAANLRIVVASRPDPPLPVDVPDGHPLRDPQIVRTLDRSAYAEVVRQDSQRELKHALQGTPAQRDLLGLVAAAGGGLSGTDLAELTGSSEWEIEELLHAVSGRTFRSRAPHWAPLTAPIYLLAHEELQRKALHMLGPSRLADYRRRLHKWARGHRDRGWPAGTPEYLLRGYHLLLRETGEVTLLVECGLDRARHERMLDLTGGDTAAMAEITVALDVLCEQDSPDLLAMMRLAIYSGQLHRRNDDIEPELPVVWAVLGRHARAEALAAMMLSTRVRTRVQEALAGRYRPEPLWWGEQPERYMRTDPRTGPYPADVQDTMATGDLARAGELALAIDVPQWRYRSLRHVVRAMAARDPAQAEQLARKIQDPRHLATMLIELIVPVADTGDRSKAEQLATEVETLGHTVAASRPDVGIGDNVRYEEIITAMVDAGDVADAERVARSLPHLRHREAALIALLTAVAETGDLTQAETLAATIDRPEVRAKALIGIVRVDPTAANRAADMIRAISPARFQDRLWGALVAALAHSDPAAAQSWVSEIHDELILLETLVGLVGVLTADDRIERAQDVAASIADLGWRETALTDIAEAMARVGDSAGAAAIAETLVRPRCKARALAAAGLTSRAEAAVAAIEEDGLRAQVVADIAIAHASRGDIDSALAVTDTIPVEDYLERARALHAVVMALVRTGERARARELAGRIPDSYVRWPVEIELALAESPAEGRRVIAQVLRGGNWPPMLTVLAKIEPTMMPAICAKLF